MEGPNSQLSFRPSTALDKEEESKGLLGDEVEATESELKKTASRDMTPDRLRKTKTGVQLFKRDAEGEKLTKEMALGLNIKVMIEKQK
jgi:hypothetical protein